MTTKNLNATTDRPYTVDLWGSHPDAGNDDCWTGQSFATREEAIAYYRDVVMFPATNQLVKVCRNNWEFVCVDGPDLHEVTANPDQTTQRRHRRENASSVEEWRREQAHQAGMAFGCDGYNDAMGY